MVRRDMGRAWLNAAVFCVSVLGACGRAATAERPAAPAQAAAATEPAIDERAITAIADRAIGGKPERAVGIVFVQTGRIVSRTFGPVGEAAMTDRTSFEIGSISKVLAGVLLADAVLRGEVALEDPVAQHLPEGWRVPDFSGKPIRLLDLATHASGFPLMPENWRSNEYTREEFKRALAAASLPWEPGSGYLYSNFGAALIALALEQRTGRSWGDLLAERLFEPLGMRDSAYVDGQRPHAGPRLQSYDEDAMPVADRIDLSPMGPCCSVRSTLHDMGLLIAAMLDARSPLAAAFAEAARRQHPAGEPVGLGWEWNERLDFLSKTGRVTGYHSALSLVPQRQGGVFSVVNSFEVDPSSIDRPLVTLLFAPKPPGAGAVHAAQLVSELPPDATPLAVTFDRQFRLEGVQAPRQVQRGRTIPLRFFYRCLSRPDRDLQSFVHGDMPDLSPEAAQAARLRADHFPGRGRDSTLNWRPNELIVDEVELSVPVDYPATKLVVWFGWYQWQRVPASGEAVATDGRARGPVLDVVP